MDLIIGKTAGFCFGVSNAVNKSKEIIKQKKNIYCLGEIVHNKEVTKELEKEGIEFIDDIEKAKENVIIRAHGEPIKTYKKAQNLGLNIIDLTCPKVTKIHNIVKEYAENEFYIMLIGQKNHPEIIGTVSYSGDYSCVIQTEQDIDNAIKEFYNTGLKRILVISQTTFSLEMFNNICKIIKEKISKNISIEIKNTICDATKLRQEETKKIAKDVDVMIIIGGKNSSNTNKLYVISSSICKNSILIENENELDINFIKKFKKVGIMAGASTPQKSINSVVEILNKTC